MEKRHTVATLCAAVTLLAASTANSLMLVPCGLAEDHYVLTDKFDKYVVKRGDTLWDISRKVYDNPARFPEIAKWSGISKPHSIFPGQEVIIPRGEGYELLAQRYNINGFGVCPITEQEGFQHVRIDHPRGTMTWMIR